MAAKLVATPDPVPVGTITQVVGSGFSNRLTRLKLDGVIAGDSFRATSSGSFKVGVLVAPTVKSQTLVAEQKQPGGSWSVVARLAPLLTFTSVPAPSDTTPPVVTALQGNNITDTSFNVSFSTNEPSTTVVNYGTTTAYLGGTVSNSSLVTTHNAFVTGLTASTLYHWRIQTTDSKGNTTISADQTITTVAGGVVDTTAPVISNVAYAINADGVSATITWTTNEPSTAGVVYGLDATYGSAAVQDLTYTQTNHVRTLTGLTPGLTYHFKCISKDASGNIGLGIDTLLPVPASSGGGTGTLTPSAGITVTTSNQTIQWLDITDGNGIHAHGSPGSPITNLTIKNCRIRNGEIAILLEYVDTFTIQDCDIGDVNYAGIIVFSGTHGNILRNGIRKVGYTRTDFVNDPYNNAYGIALTRYKVASFVTDPESATILVQDNIVEDVPLWHGLDQHGCNNITWDRNIVRRCARAAFLTVSSDGTNNISANDIIFTNNQLLEALTKTGGTNVVAVTLVTVVNVTFSGNTYSTTYGSPAVYDYGGSSTGIVGAATFVAVP